MPEQLPPCGTFAQRMINHRVQRNKPVPTSASSRHARHGAPMVQHVGTRDFSTAAIKSALIAKNKIFAGLQRGQRSKQQVASKGSKQKNESVVRSSDWFTREGTQCHGESCLDDNS
jgi:hypothetical protein